MSAALLQLGAPDLRALAVAFRAGRLVAPVEAFSIQRILGNAEVAGTVGELNALAEGATPAALARFLEVLAESVCRRGPLEDRVQLVTTGVDASANSRDTLVVVQDLFRRVSQDVLISGYSVHDGRSVFEPLGECIRQHPNLRVRMFLNIARKSDETDPLKRFLAEFSRYHWPSDVQIPEIWYDPRSLQSGPASASAVLHAKCVVIDEAELLVSSANLTEAAYLRNIEVGVLIRSVHLARQLNQFFGGLISGGHLRRADAGSAAR